MSFDSIMKNLKSIATNLLRSDRAGRLIGCISGMIFSDGSFPEIQRSLDRSGNFRGRPR
jgi:hypothetical protein